MPHPYNPSRDIPSLEGKVILITGGNIGLGKQSALDLSGHGPAEIWLAARNAQKADAALAELRSHAPDVSVRFLQLDLASFESIKSAARTFTSAVSRLDILLLNAGVMGCPPGKTKEGYEMHIGTNHVGHALLLKLLTPLLARTATDQPRSGVRVVTVSSVAHKFSVSGGIDFDMLKTNGEVSSPNNLYGQSKLANLVYATEFAKHHPEITSVSIHPGTVKTDLQTGGGNLLMRGFQRFVVPLIGVEVDEGVKSQLWAATAASVKSGEYYEPVGVAGKGNALSKSEELGRRLWEWTEKELAGHNMAT
ncbi:hypothetical protein BGZ61DRAFT_364252 [Ilyonectria robusta]|uniref:uncharacterized protein n=1 Tax=Ilyonectria robusta TaxID=1079257 RepID=UPI001E8E4616|nr:uncharacterized protein BGZ61DRAFT_364252 [Ilyonectria robusta]KAH8669411.1 hypothetical protein BGZ61DRAFT_364252 [Ilyonectria robusta]